MSQFDKLGQHLPWRLLWLETKFCYTREPVPTESPRERLYPPPHPRKVCERRLACVAARGKSTSFPQPRSPTRIQLCDVKRFARCGYPPSADRPPQQVLAAYAYYS